MLVMDWMTERPITVTPETRLSEVAAAMVRGSVRHVPVVRGDTGEGGTPLLVGIVSSYDVARAHPPELNPWALTPLPPELDHPVSEVMTAHPFTVEPTAPVERAAAELARRKIHALPVVRAERLVGILTEADVIRAFVVLLGPRQQGVRITFVLEEREEIFGSVLRLAAQHRVEVASVVTAHQGGRRIAIVQVVGPRAGHFLDGLWKAGHRVESVVHDEQLAA